MTTTERLRELEKAATAGPWGWNNYGEKSNNAVLGTFFSMATNEQLGGHVEEERYDEYVGDYKRVADLGDSIAYKEDHANYSDFALIAATRNALPAMLAVIEAAEGLKNPCRAISIEAALPIEMTPDERECLMQWLQKAYNSGRADAYKEVESALAAFREVRE